MSLRKSNCCIGFPPCASRTLVFGVVAVFGGTYFAAMEGALGRVARQQSAHRPGLDGRNRQRPAADAPTGIGQLVVVVVAQVPNHIDHLIPVLTPVVGDARNAPSSGAGPSGPVIDLTDDRVFGPGDRGDGGDRLGDRLLTAVG